MDKDDWLSFLNRSIDFAHTILAPEVTLGENHQHHLRRSDFFLERINVYEVIDVQKDGAAGHQELQLPLDCGSLVLCRAPRV